MDYFKVSDKAVSSSRIFETEPLVLNGKKVTIINPYSLKKNIYKGQLHCHTTNSSDAVDSPVTLLTAYKNAGYSFVAITDHEFMTSQQAVPGILHIRGSEDGTVDGHILSIGTMSEKQSTISQEVVDLINEDRGFCVMAHPNWIVLPFSNDKLLEIRGYHAIEVYNALVSRTEGAAEEQIDYVLRNGIMAYLTASDDCHGISTQNFNVGWVNLYADDLNELSVMESLKRGNFYSSIGAEMSIWMEENKIIVSCPSPSNIEFITSRGISKSSTNSTSSFYEIYGDEKYVRVNITRISDNKKAWSNPIQVILQGHNQGSIQVVEGGGNSGSFKELVFETNSSDVFRCNATSSSGWDGTITSISSNVITFSTISGNSNSIIPASQFNLGKVRLYNSSKSNDYALIVGATANTIILDRSVSGNWNVGNTVTPKSPFVVTGIHYDIEITLGNLYGRTGGILEAYLIDALGSGAIMYLHPFETYANSKQIQRFTQSGVWFSSIVSCKINQNVISLAWKSNGTGTMSIILREAGYLK